MDIVTWNHPDLYEEYHMPFASLWAREAAEAERLEKMLKIENEENDATNDLALVIQNRNKARAGQADSFFDSLIDKYANKAQKTKKTSPTRTAKKKTTKRKA